MGYGVFARLKSSDGYRIQEVSLGAPEQPSHLSLHLTVEGGGDLVNLANDPAHEGTVELATYDKPTTAQMGAICRERLVMEAVCRYLNTGGVLENLQGMLTAIEPLVSGTLVFPGFHLLDSTPNQTNAYEHIFVADDPDSNEAVVWVEGDSGFIDCTTLEAIRDVQRRNRQEEEGETDFDAALREYDGNEEALEADLDALLDPEHHSRPQLPGGSAQD